MECQDRTLANGRPAERVHVDTKTLAKKTIGMGGTKVPLPIIISCNFTVHDAPPRPRTSLALYLFGCCMLNASASRSLLPHPRAADSSCSHETHSMLRYTSRGPKLYLREHVLERRCGTVAVWMLYAPRRQCRRMAFGRAITTLSSRTFFTPSDNYDFVPFSHPCQRP
jgi:hypothetical protein